MKNIHLIPTKNPSNFFSYVERKDILFLDLRKERIPVNTVQHYHLYITTEEDMKKAFVEGILYSSELSINDAVNEWFEKFKKK